MLAANPTQQLQAQAHLRGYTNQSNLGSQIRKQNGYGLLLAAYPPVCCAGAISPRFHTVSHPPRLEP